MKTYVTFGQCHCHKYDGVIFDKDCVAVIEAPSEEEAREFLFRIWGGKFCFTYPEKNWDKSKMKYFPDGYKYLQFSKTTEE